MGHSKRLACSIHDAPSGEFFDTFQCVANSTSPLNPWLQPRTGLQERQAGPDLWPCMSPCQLRFPPSETRWQFLPRNLAGIQSKSTPSLQEVGRRVIETLLGDSLCKFSDNGTGDTDCKEGERGPHIRVPTMQPRLGAWYLQTQDADAVPCHHRHHGHPLPTIIIPF